MDSGPSSHSLATSLSRVGSPRAANTGAAFARAALLLRDIPLDVLGLLGPSAIVGAERLRAALGGNLVEPRFYDRQAGPPGDRLQPELDQGHRLLRVVVLHVDRV